MSEQAQPEREMDAEEAEEGGGSRLLWFLAGALTGAVIGILYAPCSGRHARDTITGTSRDIYDRSRDTYIKAKQLVDDAADLFERGRRLASGGI